MLHHRPRPFIVRSAREAFYSIYNPLKRLYWFLFHPTLLGAKVLIFHNNKLLLVRIGYAHRKWVLPGGAVDHGEEVNIAALRELREESGLVATNLTHIGTRFYQKEYKDDTVHYFVGSVDNDDITIDDQEIIDAGWFPLDELPKERMPRVDEAIEMYNNWKHGKG